MTKGLGLTTNVPLQASHLETVFWRRQSSPRHSWVSLISDRQSSVCSIEVVSLRPCIRGRSQKRSRDCNLPVDEATWRSEPSTTTSSSNVRFVSAITRGGMTFGRTYRADGSPDSVGVVHLHGILGRTDRGRVVLTEADYQIMQNGAPCWQEQWFVERLRTSTCLFLGASMSDPNLIRYLHRAPSSGHQHFAILIRSDMRLDDDASPEARRRCEEAEQLRWAKLGVSVLFADNYADVAQFIWELVYKIQDGATYRSLPQRMRDWWRSEQARGCLYASDETEYRRLQDDLHDVLRELLNDVIELLTPEAPELTDEVLQISLWVVSPPEDGDQERVQTLAHTDRLMTSPSTRETIVLDPTSNWSAVKSLCLGRPMDERKDTYASRWKYVVALPIYRQRRRIPLGAVTISSMSPPDETALSQLSPRALGSLDQMVQEAAEKWLTLSS